jgi:WD40 repeat protein
VIWDFQKGKQHASFRGFSRSIGPITFTDRNQMVCVEGLQHGVGSILHSWEAGRRCQHEFPDMITALSPVKESVVLVSRYDRTILLWDLASNQIQKERRIDFWPRSSRVNRDTDQALLLHEGASLIDLRNLSVQSSTMGKIGGGVSRCAAIASDGKSYFIANFNGHVFVADKRADSLAIRRQRLADADGQAQGIEVIKGQPVVAIAGANGRVDFVSTENATLIGSILTQGERLTSMHVSPSGEFLALGDSNSTMTFWDLRVLHVPMLLTLPFAKSRPLHLAAVNGLVEDKSLSPAVKGAVEFMARILRHRFRYDIEIGEVQAIRAGEFDIEIE